MKKTVEANDQVPFDTLLLRVQALAIWAARHSRQAIARHSVLAKLARWTKQVGEKAVHIHRLTIGPRLALCFVFIILAMLVGNAVLVWQFQGVRAQAERLSGVDRELITVLQAHTNLMSFYERLDALAHSESTADW